MSLLPRLPPTFDAALRDVRADGPEFRLEAAVRLGDPPPGREGEARTGLIALLADTWAPVRAAAVVALGLVGLDGDLDRVRRAVRDPHASVREAAVEALARLGGDDVAEELESFLEHECAAVRFQAVRALAALGRTELAGALARYVSDPDAHVRAEVALALGETGGAEHADALATLLRDREDAVCFAAAVALATLGDTRAVSRLRREIARGTYRVEAARALARLRAEDAREDLAALAARFFAPAIDRVAAAEALLALGDPRGIAALARVLRSPFLQGKDAAIECVGTFGVSTLIPELAHLVEKSGSIDTGRLEVTLEKLAEASPEAVRLLRTLRTTRA